MTLTENSSAAKANLAEITRTAALTFFVYNDIEGSLTEVHQCDEVKQEVGK